MASNLHCFHSDDLVIAFVFLAAFQYLAFAFPIKSLQSFTASKTQYYHLHIWRGEKVKVQCDVRIAGFNENTVEVVWALHLRRLSYCGCNPRDPVMTLLELVHNESNSEADQIYSAVLQRCVRDRSRCGMLDTVDGQPWWTFHAEGAALDKDMTNARTAWVGITMDKARLEDSGIYKCQALVGKANSSLPKMFSFSYTVLTVSDQGPSNDNFFHMSIEKSIAANDYDSTVVRPIQNHRRVGQSVYITCAPRLLHRAPTLPFPVSLIYIRFLPFYQPDGEFITVARYSVDGDTFDSNPPVDRKWEFNYTGIKPDIHRAIDSIHLRIDIRIPSVRLEDTGIFRCSVTKANTGDVYQGEAGLKVSKDPKFQSGFCNPLRPEEERGLLHSKKMFDKRNKKSPSGFDLFPDIAHQKAKDDDAAPELTKGASAEVSDDEKNIFKEDPVCLTAVSLMIVALLLLLVLARKTIFNTIFCIPDETRVQHKIFQSSVGKKGDTKYIAATKIGAPPPPPPVRDMSQPAEPEPEPEPEPLPKDTGDKKKKKKKKKKKEKKKKKKKKKDTDEKSKKVVQFVVDNSGDNDISPFNSQHVDFLYDGWLQEVPCIHGGLMHGHKTIRDIY